MAHIDLSVAIIFKNEIRCLERCLKSLQPLKERLSCEIVMADTGSTDGSRAVAERYADTVFDFPWINDFSAARNAVLDRCSGNWFLVLDSDEWLDEDVDDLVRMARLDPERFRACYLTIRSYTDKEMTDYADTMHLRMLSRAYLPRYEGAIHESPVMGRDEGANAALRNVLIHHDGYVVLNDGSEAGKSKRERNVALLRGELRKEPDDLRRIMQFMDVGFEELEFVEVARRGVTLIQNHAPRWEMYGPPVLRHAIQAAYQKKLPELMEWVELMRELYPENYFFLIDVAYIMVFASRDRGDYEETVRWGRMFLKSRAKYDTDPEAVEQRMVGALTHSNASAEQSVRIVTARAYRNLEQMEEAVEILREIRWEVLDEVQTSDAMSNVILLHLNSNCDLSVLITDFWTKLEKKESRRKFLDMGAAVFTPVSDTKGLDGAEDGAKPDKELWEVFLPLRGKCVLGDAAAIMASASPEETEDILAGIEDMTDFPAAALEHALRIGCAFPSGRRPVRMEEADTLAAGLAEQPGIEFLPIALSGANSLRPRENWQRVLWLRALMLAAVRKFDWSKSEETDGETSGRSAWELARAFASVEAEFLPRCYTMEALDELSALPPLHRFGWKLTQAFEALDDGDTVTCLRLLREGLVAAPETKEMAQSILSAVERRMKERDAVSPELRALAEQVKLLLTRFPADDPAVEELKKSEAYRKVAHLIEG